MTISYGAQQNGLLCGYRFTPTAGAEPIDLQQAIAWLASAPASQSNAFIWLHFDLTDASARAWMAAHCGPRRATARKP